MIKVSKKFIKFVKKIDMLKKYYIIFCVLIILIFISIYNLIYKDHRDITKEKAIYELAVSELNQDFNNDTDLANKKYLDKTIVIYGVISFLDFENTTIVLESSISARMKEQISSVKTGDKVKIKGRFIGYDDLLDEYKIDECVILD